MVTNYSNENNDFNLNKQELEELMEFENKINKIIDYYKNDENPIIKNMFKEIELNSSITEIRLEQKKTNNIIPKHNMRELIKEISQDFWSDMNFTETAFDMIQCAAEDYIINIFQESNLIAINSSRDFILPKDMKLNIRFMKNKEV